MKVYTKPTRYNLTLSFDQYKFLLARKKEAQKNRERIKYKDLVKEWGVKQYYMATAMNRGIKQYDYRIWKESQGEDRDRSRPVRGDNSSRNKTYVRIPTTRLQTAEGREVDGDIRYRQSQRPSGTEASHRSI